MHLHISHETQYRYTPPVGATRHWVCMRPRVTARQLVLAHDLQVEPGVTQWHNFDDEFGNPRSSLALNFTHDHLRVLSVSEIQTTPPPFAPSQTAWEPVRDQLHQHAQAAPFTAASFYTPYHPDFATYALASFTPGRPLLAAACELSARMHHDFRYQPLSTDIATPIHQSFVQRCGVCQDFAHILIACLRGLGLAARYVSGYLLTVPPPGQPRLVGSDASHAWAQVFVPDLPGAEFGSGWYDLDPTNLRHGWGSPGEDYVTTAWGRDFSDVSPLSGVIHGSADHTLSVAVTVQPVAVQPVAAPAAAPAVV